MNILILSSATSSRNASIVLDDLIKSLKLIDNCSVRALVRSWDNNASEVVTLDTRFGILLNKTRSRLLGLMHKLGILKEPLQQTHPDYNIRNYDQTIEFYPTKRILKAIPFKPDRIIVLAMQNAFTFKNLYEVQLKTGAPIYLYMMDMAPMTGGCHFAWNCNGYYNHCGNCPAYLSVVEKDQSRVNWHYKKKYTEMMNIIPLATTEWQYLQLKRSSLYSNKQKAKILFSIDEEIFKPHPKVQACKYFKLPDRKKIIFFGASSINIKRKGLDQLVKILNILQSLLNPKEISNTHLVFAGNNVSEYFLNMDFTKDYLGRLTHDELSIMFSAADVFISPSVEDTGPMMINQSMMCGTPVVAFRMGGAVDFIEHGITGFISELYDASDVAANLKVILSLNQETYNEMRNNCRAKALQLCSHKSVAEKFKQILD